MKKDNEECDRIRYSDCQNWLMINNYTVCKATAEDADNCEERSPSRRRCSLKPSRIQDEVCPFKLALYLLLIISP